MNAETPRRKEKAEEGQMAFDDEDPPYVEVDAALNELSGSIIAAAIEVHRRLGTRLHEALCEAALCVELRARRISFVRQALIPVTYRGEMIGEKKLDLNRGQTHRRRTEGGGSDRPGPSSAAPEVSARHRLSVRVAYQLQCAGAKGMALSV